MSRVDDIFGSRGPVSRRGLLAGLGTGLLTAQMTGSEQSILAAVDPNTTQPVNSLAHFAYGVDQGSSWKTSFVFICPDSTGATVQLVTYSTNGSPLPVPVVGSTTDSQHSFNVPANGSVQVDLDETASNWDSGIRQRKQRPGDSRAHPLRRHRCGTASGRFGCA